MSWIKRTFQIFASLFVIVNLTISFDYNPTFESNPRTSYIELLVSNKDVISRVIRFDTAQQLLLFSNSTKDDNSKFDWFRRIQTAHIKNVLGFKVQKHTSLELKPSLLKIVLNDIVQPKSHQI